MTGFGVIFELDVQVSTFYAKYKNQKDISLKQKLFFSAEKCICRGKKIDCDMVIWRQMKSQNQNDTAVHNTVLLEKWNDVQGTRYPCSSCCQKLELIL